MAAVVLGLCLACAAAYASQPGLQAEEAADPAADRPNVILVLTDDQPESTLPHMRAVQNRLVSEGRTFENNVANYPLCCPARATIQTGKLAQNTGVFENDAPHGGYGKFVEGGHEQRTAATWLQAAGYNTGYLGRYMHDFTGSSLPPAGTGSTPRSRRGQKAGSTSTARGESRRCRCRPGGRRTQW